MTTHLKRLMHFNIGIADIAGRHGSNDKLIGNYSSEERALQGMASVAGKEGYRDWPDGFRLFDLEVDRDYFREGFRTEDGEDIAIAGDSSGLVGNDEGLERWGDDESEDDALFNLPDRIPDEGADDGRSRPFRELGHYKISARNSQSYGDMGFKLVGNYSSVAKPKRPSCACAASPAFATGRRAGASTASRWTRRAGWRASSPWIMMRLCGSSPHDPALVFTRDAEPHCLRPVTPDEAPLHPAAISPRSIT